MYFRSKLYVLRCIMQFILIPFVCMMLLNSCLRERIRESECNVISFTPVYKNLQSRSSAVTEEENTVHNLGLVGKDSLFLHGSVSEMTDELATRGAINTSSNFTDPIYVLGYYYTDNWDANKKPNFVFNEKIEKTGPDGSYTFSSKRYWPRDGKMRFLAYTPSDGVHYKLESNATTHNPKIWYGLDKDAPTEQYKPGQVGLDISQQKDLLVGYTDEIDCKTQSVSNTPVTLKFHHVLAAVKFEWDESNKPVGATLNSITLKYIASRGHYYFLKNGNGSDPSKKGSYPGSTYQKRTNFIITANEPVTAGSNSILGDNFLFMVKQPFRGSGHGIADDMVKDPKGKAYEPILEVNLTLKGGEKKTLSTKLLGVTPKGSWDGGKKYIYKISKKLVPDFVNAIAKINYLALVSDRLLRTKKG